MTVSFGLPPSALVLTPRGQVPLVSIAPGDVVASLDPESGTWSEARVLATPSWSADQVVDVAYDGGVLVGVTPGTGVWDAFEEGWRAVGSLSTLSQLLVGDAFRVTPRDVTGFTERAVELEVRHLTLAPPHLAFVADGVVVRHKEA